MGEGKRTSRCSMCRPFGCQRSLRAESSFSRPARACSQSRSLDCMYSLNDLSRESSIAEMVDNQENPRNPQRFDLLSSENECRGWWAQQERSRGERESGGVMEKSLFFLQEPREQEALRRREREKKKWEGEGREYWIAWSERRDGFKYNKSRFCRQNPI